MAGVVSSTDMVDTTYYVWLFVFAIIAYVCIVDENVPKFLYLMVQILRINVIRFFWGTKMRIGLEFSTWKMKRDMKKFLKEKQLQDENNDRSEIS
jgi:hypothetical protein